MAPAPSKQLCTQAAALRIKYKISDQLQRVTPGLIGFHPKNRMGEPPNGDRCKSLAKDILRVGFDPEEADFNAVMLQEKPGSRKFHDYNVKQCEGDPLLAPLVKGFEIAYASLAHSHLNQSFKNLLMSVDMGIDELLGNDGKPSLEALEKADALYHSYCISGCKWEILSYKMEEEDPSAAEILQAAFNVKNSVAMQIHVMEAIRALTSWLKAEEVANRTVTFAGAKDKLALTLGPMVDDPHFMDMFRFVVDIGGEDALSRLHIQVRGSEGLTN